DLTGVWRFQPDPTGEGAQRGYAGPDLDDARWREVWVPSCWDVAVPSLSDYEGYGWYRRVLEIPDAWRGRRIALRFYGVHHHAQVWVGGALAGTHEDGFLGFEVDITALLRWGEPTLLAVRADNIRRAGDVPGLERGWRTFGGLQRRVELICTDRLRLGEVRLTATPNQSRGTLQVAVEAVNGREDDAPVSLRVRVIDSSGQELAQFAGASALVPSGSACTTTLAGDVPDVALWSPAQPALYTVQVSLLAGGEETDSREMRTGFRSIAVRDGRLLLNGEPLTLTGFNRHEDTPSVAMAEDLDTVRRDLRSMREAGANFVRLCHYPHHPDELDLCDELGLLAMGEIPLYWWRGEAEGDGMPAIKLAAAERQLRGMIQRDSHHPSLIFWSVSNETEEQRPEVAQGNAHLVRVAQDVDPSRLAVHVSNHWRSDPHFEADDVICVNGYPSLERRGLGGEAGYDLARSTDWWREGFAALHERYPEKPVLVTEFGYAALEGSQTNALGEDWQARAIEAEFAGMQAPYVCGATVWCWADHAWPANVYSYCHGLAVSPYGVVTRVRRPKAALATVKRFFRSRHGIPEPEPAPPPRGPSGDVLYMVRPTLEDIPEVDFPEGYGIRAMQPNEGGLWEDIWRDTEPYFTIANGLFERAFGSNPVAMAWRCYLVTGPRGVAVGTLSAWSDSDYLGEPWGQVHWVAIRPAYQRKGLARAALAYTLRQLAQWHTHAYLGTQSLRLPAIRLYLDMGFLPDLRHPGARQAWAELAKQIDHPALRSALGEPGSV
ncbi:MAG: GNAT family N-acetyltransferase, partial [Anaerolineae bacterium]